MAAEFVGRRRECRFYTAGCGNKMAVSVTGPRAVNELGGPVIRGALVQEVRTCRLASAQLSYLTKVLPICCTIRMPYLFYLFICGLKKNMRPNPAQLIMTLIIKTSLNYMIKYKVMLKK